MFNHLKDELKTRKIENKNLQNAIEQEKIRLQQERDTAKKSILRKIKVIDNMKRKQEEKQNAKTLSDFAAQKKTELSAARAKRTREFTKAHARQFLLIIVSIITLSLVISGIIRIVNHAKTVKNYREAVTLIIDKNYAAAEKLLEGISYSDSDDLLCYARIEKSIDEQSRTIKNIYSSVQSIGTISNIQIQERFAQTTSGVRFAYEVQSLIDAIELKTLPSDLRVKVETIDNSIGQVGARYSPLLETDTYELAKRVLYHIENNTDTGAVILAVSQLPGTISLADEATIKEVRQKYDSLSDADKNDVCNIQILLSAESALQTLVEEKTAAERAAAEQAAKEAAEREAAEKVANEAAEKEAQNNASSSGTQPSQSQEGNKPNHPKESDGVTVYTTPSGKCYHLDPDCGGKNSRPTTLTKAQSSGYRPCEKCA